jgi:hypothetical protein
MHGKALCWPGPPTSPVTGAPKIVSGGPPPKPGHGLRVLDLGRQHMAAGCCTSTYVTSEVHAARSHRLHSQLRVELLHAPSSGVPPPYLHYSVRVHTHARSLTRSCLLRRAALAPAAGTSWQLAPAGGRCVRACAAVAHRELVARQCGEGLTLQLVTSASAVALWQRRPCLGSHAAAALRVGCAVAAAQAPPYATCRCRPLGRWSLPPLYPARRSALVGPGPPWLL